MNPDHALNDVFNFLNQLREHNDRDWFNQHKKDYQKALADMVNFADVLIAEMNKMDHIETKSGKQSLFRIYRDTRFSSDKTPYKSHWSGHLRRATNKLRGGYYYHIQPGGSYIAGGFFGPNAKDLKHIRAHIAQDDAAFRKVIDQQATKIYFGELQGEQVKTAPKGYRKDDPAIELLRHKQYIFKHSFSDSEVVSDDFLPNMVDGYKKLMPFFDYFSEVLNTDLNGVPLSD